MLRTISQIAGDSGVTYYQQLNDPRWIERSKQFRVGRNFCNSCRQSNKVLHVHHTNYGNKKAWEYPDEELVVLCEECHDSIHKAIRVFRNIASFSNATNIQAITGMLANAIKNGGDRKCLELLVKSFGRMEEINE